MVDPVRLGSDRAAAEVGRVAIGLQARRRIFCEANPILPLESMTAAFGMALLACAPAGQARRRWRQSISATRAIRASVTTMIRVISANRLGLSPTCWYCDQR
jgi:hypothetical protein